MTFSSLLAVILSLSAISCNKTPIEDDSAKLEQEKKEKEVAELLAQVKSSKAINTFDEKATWYYTMGPDANSPFAKFSRKIVTGNKVEGTGAFVFTYEFSGMTKNQAQEKVFFQHKFGDFRPDLSFSPLGVSMWIRGHRTNKGTFRFVLLHDDKLYPDNYTIRQTFEYSDPDILKCEDWTQLVIPYSWFKNYDYGEGDLELSHVIGYRIEIVNEEGKEAQNCEFLIDNLEQLTSYEPQYTPARFSSIFIQLNKVYENYDWEWAFTSCLDAGIDTWIIQYSVGYGSENNVCWYQNTNLDWVSTKYHIVDDMVAAAEKLGFKLIFGLNGGDYSRTNSQDQAVYDNLVEKNKLVVDEIVANFGSSSCFAGWYITEEFHDGTWPVGWQQDKAREMLGDYLNRVGEYAKSKIDLPVSIAPALWRGMPAKLCGEWFEKLFDGTPNIDVLYLQDCAGRGPATITSIEVDLPNYYNEIKKACDKTGVKFGVDVESFMDCYSPSIPYEAKKWDYLKRQLEMAGNYTDYITNFSWATFKPSVGGFNKYCEYVKTLDN